jgi:hypothetical protein
VVRAGEVDPIAHLVQAADRALVPGDRFVADPGSEERERVPDVDREPPEKTGILGLLEGVERAHVLVERLPVRPLLEVQPAEEPEGLRPAEAVPDLLEQRLGLEGLTRSGLDIEVLPCDLRTGEEHRAPDPRLVGSESLERVREEPVGTREVAHREVQLTEGRVDLRELPAVVVGERGEVDLHAFEVVRRGLGVVLGARRVRGAPVVRTRLLADLPEEEVAAQLRDQVERRVRVRPLHRFRDLAVEHAHSALGERPVDPRPERLLREREPVPAGALGQDPLVDQFLETLSQRLFLRPHRRDQEGEIELGPDRARVGEDAVLFGGQAVEPRPVQGRHDLHGGRVGHPDRSSAVTRLKLRSNDARPSPFGSGTRTGLRPCRRRGARTAGPRSFG